MTTLGNDGKKVCIWDIEKSISAMEISAETPMHSFSWKADGSLMTTSGKSMINVWDPRTAKEPTLVCTILYLYSMANYFLSMQSGLGHEGIKGSKAMWLGDSNCIFSVGTDKVLLAY